MRVAVTGVVCLFAAAATALAPALQPRPAAAARTPSEWHVARRQQIIEAHPEVKDLFGVEPTSLPLLISANVLHTGAAVLAGSLLAHGQLALLFALCYAGSFLSVAQFSLLHDLVHGSESSQVGFICACYGIAM